MSVDPVTTDPVTPASMGHHHDRVDGRLKVTGRAPYAVEHRDPPMAGDPLHLWMVQSTIARGRVVAISTDEARAHPGVWSVLDHTNAPRLGADVDEPDTELMVLQDGAVHFRGQVVAVVLAASLESAREAAGLVRVSYAEEEAETEFGPDTETDVPEQVNPNYAAVTEDGDVEAGMAEAAVVIDQTYETPYEHNNPLEPHATTARWDGERLHLIDSTQGPYALAATLAPLLGLSTDTVRVEAPYVGGGFGSKGQPHAPQMVAALAAMTVPGRVVRLAVTRQQMFALTGYRTRTVQHVRLGARADGTLTALTHEVVEQTSRWKEFAEQTAVSSRTMYGTANRRTSHRLARLDVAVPSFMRAPGEMPGMFASEVAIDELAEACGIDPVDLRVRNEPTVDPETGKPFSRRRLVECLQRGASRFGWEARPPQPRSVTEGEWWVGTGVAAQTYPAKLMPDNVARVTARAGGVYQVEVGAVDIGTGARTAMLQIAADALGVDPSCVHLSLGDSQIGPATVAGGSSGTGSWGSAVVAAAQLFRADHGADPDPGVSTTASAAELPAADDFALHSFGAVFAEVRVHRWTGELRVPRLLGVYSVGRIVNPMLARSQFLGGLVMGLSSALFEESYRDARFGHVVTQDLASYHVAAHADIGDITVDWLDDHGDDADLVSTPMGTRGLGEIGIVGTAAAVANATFHATGTRVRNLPLTADRFL